MHIDIDKIHVVDAVCRFQTGAHLLETVTKLEVSRAKIEAIPR